MPGKPHDGPPRPITAELRVILENREDLGPEWAEYQPPIIVLTITSGSGLVVRLHAFPVDQDRSEDESPAGRRRALSVTVSVRSHDAGRSVERWAELLPPLLEDRCQVAALSQSPAEQGGLQCAESCVAGGGCIQQGEEVVNDHRPNEWVPRVTSVGQQGLCDLASASCVAISIRGRHLWPSVGLRCRVRQGEQAWNIAPATYRSAEEVQCHLPVASVRRLRHTADVVPWTIQHGLCVEDSRGAICVCHPGYIGTHCQIRETPPDFITLAEEMGDEAIYAPREALDFRYR
ncbi:hypothetical protein FJT64_006186 [Amphibalanus amphitrite]|uniref:EGF-like domain-containing protein n=1 Tax=Amphibalanus amphitrite TaxID=1232801 RepID=A0A6A4VZU9_AMPAM|nr:hypothetical protein FJT64_006186 [Amphibalanus amphitrite]